MDYKVCIGKFTLESLTKGLYLSPKDLYREYIQNAADSIDEAIKLEIVGEEEAEIVISLDSNLKKLSIKDNGCGICSAQAVRQLIDIGNSEKKHSENRGFRGIGRLAGLSYCDKLVFTTSFIGENVRTKVTFDAKMLRTLLAPDSSLINSVEEVIEKVVTINTVFAKEEDHFFNVELYNISDLDGLSNPEKIEKYLIENAPVDCKSDFIWHEVISKKFQLINKAIPTYHIVLEADGEKVEIHKPYSDTIISDRVKKVENTVNDIEVVTFKNASNDISAVLWYAVTDYNGTILDDQVKGIRIRKGNLLIGDKKTMGSFFKEDRFNGWLIGELHVFDKQLIPNTRRDDFEKNERYLSFSEQIGLWSKEISKEIRSISYNRSLSETQKRIIVHEEKELLESDFFDNESSLVELDEFSLMEQSDSFRLAQGDLLGKLSALTKSNAAITKYAALNINKKLTIEQKKTIEKVLDIVGQEFSSKRSKKIADVIINNI